MDPLPAANFTIPGMNVGCTSYHALIRSNLQCFFDSSCINTTSQWVSTLPMLSFPKPLNRSLLSQYSFKDNLQSIYQNMMTDQTQIAMNFNGYYANCAPETCSYTYVRRFDYVYILTMLIGLLGSLVISLRFVSPRIIEAFHRLYALFIKSKENRLNRTCSQTPQQRKEIETVCKSCSKILSAWYRRIISLFTQIKTKLLSVNFFKVGVVVNLSG